MPIPSSPALSDERRLSALRRYDILDTPPEQGFDDIVELAKQICRTPVALVSLVSDQRQWFKAKSGLDLCETPLSQSVCANAVAERRLLIIPDLAQDQRTQDNTLVTQSPYIRFYAGAPLTTSDGHILGTICVIDNVPRPDGLSAAEAGALMALARQVVSLLELRRSIIQRDIDEDRYRLLFNSISAGFCVVQVKFDGAENAIDYQFLDVNSSFERSTGIKAAAGQWMRTIAPQHEEFWFERCGQVALSREAMRFEGQAAALGRWFEVYAFPSGPKDQHQVGLLFTDVTEQRSARQAVIAAEQRLHEQQMLLNEELSHRMKNSFAMVQAIAIQTLRSVPDQEPVAAFIKRLHALSAAHDALLDQKWMAAEVDRVVKGVLATLTDPGRFDVSGPAIELGPRAALSTSLLLHELTTNAIKYGALSNENGTVSLSWGLTALDCEAEFSLTWREIGGPPVMAPDHKGFGSKLIAMGLVGTGGVDLRYLRSGLQAEFKAPLAQVQVS